MTDENQLAGLTGINMTTRNYDDDDACNTSLYGGVAEIQALSWALGFRVKLEVCPSHLPPTSIPPRSHLDPKEEEDPTTSYGDPT